MKSMISLFLFLISFQLAGCATSSQNKTLEEMVKSGPTSIEDQWGIKVLSVRLTASDYMIDFRYRILDSEKASALVQKGVKPFLVDQATGTKMDVPKTKLGPMRQSSVKPFEDRNYFILFGNPGNLVKQGSRVTVVIGDFSVENLVVE
jgi:hypothetical protein